MSDWISTKETTRILGVAPTTLRRWADEGKLVCQRTAGGHRRFLRSSIESLRQTGFEATTSAPELREWVAFLRNNDVHRVRQRLNRLYAESENWFAVADFLGSVSVEIGELWAEGELSVIEEHIVSARLYHAVSALSCEFDVPRGAPVGFLTTIAEEHHALALSLVQVCMRSVNIDALIPGTNMPITELLHHIRTNGLGVSIIALSASRWSSDPISLARSYDDIAAACREEDIDLVVGGEGQWPEGVEYGHRCRSFRELEQVLEAWGYLD